MRVAYRYSRRPSLPVGLIELIAGLPSLSGRKAVSFLEGLLVLGGPWAVIQKVVAATWLQT